MFIKLDKNAVLTEKKAVYLFKFYLDYRNNDIVYKIGVTSREEVGHRLAEVLLSFYTTFRYVPRVSVLRFSSCDEAFAKEKELHNKYYDCKVSFLGKFNGCSEFFYIDDEDGLLATYDKLVKGI